jgi:lactoylglutathione lyase
MLHVRDLDRAVAFYTGVLGLALADRHAYEGARLVYLSVPGSGFEIELVSPDPWPFGDAPEPGRTHVAFTVEDLEAQHRRLSSLGVAVDPIAEYRANGEFQTRYFYFADPEGNQIEFLEPTGRYALGGRCDAEP